MGQAGRPPTGGDTGCANEADLARGCFWALSSLASENFARRSSGRRRHPSVHCIGQGVVVTFSSPSRLTRLALGEHADAFRGPSALVRSRHHRQRDRPRVRARVAHVGQSSRRPWSAWPRTRRGPQHEVRQPVVDVEFSTTARLYSLAALALFHRPYLGSARPAAATARLGRSSPEPPPVALAVTVAVRCRLGGDGAGTRRAAQASLSTAGDGAVATLVLMSLPPLPLDRSSSDSWVLTPAVGAERTTTGRRRRQARCHVAVM